MPDRITERRAIYRGWLDVSDVSVTTADGEAMTRPVIEHPSGAAVLAYDPERRVALLVSQMRPPVLEVGEARFLEPIAGALDGDASEECARREAMEEGGVRLDVLDPLGTVWMTPASSTERVSLFLAAYRERDRVAEGGGLDEEQEHLRVSEVALAELAAMAEDGRMRDAKLLMLVQALRLRRPELFEAACAS